MHHDRARLFRVCRHTACALALAATLTTAASAVTTPTADAKNLMPDETSAQAQQRGPYRTELPPLNGHPGTTHESKQAPPEADSETGIPAAALAAYRAADEIMATTDPNCHLDWELIAGIGHVESGHGASYGLKDDGTTEQPILGPRLDGREFALIRDTDGGQYDGDPEYDRAVGPLQFIPSTWKQWGADGDADGQRDPGNINDAALAAGLYLCAGDRDLAKPDQLDAAILSYNNSRTYVNTVLAWMRHYQQHTPTPTGEKTSNAPRSPRSTPQEPKPSVPPRTPTPSKPDREVPAPPPVTKPKPTPAPPKPEPEPEPVRPKPVTELERVGPKQLTAQARHAFAVRPETTARRSDGTPAAGIQVRYEITGTTDTRFAGGTRVVTVTTDRRGTATAPVLNAETKTGTFTIRAHTIARPEIETTFQATVTAPPADQLTYVDELPLEAEIGELLAGPVKFRAAHRGTPLAGVTLTATILSEQGEPLSEGPYFTDPAGQPLHTVTLAPTNSEGLATLPDLLAGEVPGTYVLRLTAHGGARLDVPLTVDAAQDADRPEQMDRS
ncbi:lytic transglycosylase [Streptomyces sp. TRM66268-LWL]|uniref:Lytic transglycosylase n=1 Tax=Streptomyces polyasparticus TaxID=2767826 RepID=A0ABR7STQ9_9ACTN|nr:lytic transglycosylase [Streptomyces polyasparticus]MBC9718861.1 lytic transglycosylase [Streptomyces polyasparticus]